MTRLVVTAAVVEQRGRLLVTRRQRGAHLEGYWEFPGGKREPDESLQCSLVREIREELAVDAEVGEEIFTTSHVYDDRIVELHFFRCALAGDPVPQLGQEMRWIERSDLDSLTFPPADAEFIEQLRRSPPLGAPCAREDSTR